MSALWSDNLSGSQLFRTARNTVPPPAFRDYRTATDAAAGQRSDATTGNFHAGRQAPSRSNPLPSTGGHWRFCLPLLSHEYAAASKEQGHSGRMDSVGVVAVFLLAAVLDWPSGPRKLHGVSHVPETPYLGCAGFEKPFEKTICAGAADCVMSRLRVELRWDTHRRVGHGSSPRRQGVER